MSRGQIDVHGRRGGARVGGGLHARRPRLVRARLGVLPERPARRKRAARVAGGGAWPRRCRRGRRGARRRGRLLLRRPLAWVASITSVRTLDSALRQRKGNARSRNHKGRADVPRLDAPIVVWKWWTHVANDGLAGGARLLVPRDFDTRAAECIAESTWAHALSSSAVLPKLVRAARIERSAHV